MPNYRKASEVHWADRDLSDYYTFEVEVLVNEECSANRRSLRKNGEACQI